MMMKLLKRGLLSLGWLASAASADVSGGVTGVRTIEELRQLDPRTASEVVSVSGYYASGDGGGGRFRYELVNLGADDGLWVASAVLTGRWRREVGHVLTPPMFGARGDGVTDDTARLQAMIDAIRPSGADTVRLPRRTYLLASPRPAPVPGGSRALLSMTTDDLAGRPLRILGDRARLFSDVSPDAAPIFFARASFGSLRIAGVIFEKTSRPLTYAEDTAEGLYLVPFDRREIASVKLLDCEFINCHRAFTIGGATGSNTWGKLHRFVATRCQFLHPYGANALTGATHSTGNQMTLGDAWIDLMIYRDCVFDGASAGPLDEATCPGLRIPDGSHYGCPLHLIFAGNVVRHFSVEGVFKTSEFYLDVTVSEFTMPPIDGISTASVTIGNRDSDFSPGMEIFIQGAGLMRVVSFTEAPLTVAFLNLGGPGNLLPGRPIAAGRIIYGLNPPLKESIIANNFIDGAPPPGSPSKIGFTGPGFPGIAINDTRAVIQGNTILNCASAIAIYSGQVPRLDWSAGTTVADNHIRTIPAVSLPAGYVSGIFVESSSCRILDNDIATRFGTRFYGIYPLASDTLILRNRIECRQPAVNGYGSPNRTTGILIGDTSSSTVVHGNRTRGLDVGVGPNPNGPAPFSVGRHRSVGDALSVDFTGAATTLSAEEIRALDAVPRVPPFTWPPALPP